MRGPVWSWELDSVIHVGSYSLVHPLVPCQEHTPAAPPAAGGTHSRPCLKRAIPTVPSRLPAPVPAAALAHGTARCQVCPQCRAGQGLALQRCSDVTGWQVAEWPPQRWAPTSARFCSTVRCISPSPYAPFSFSVGALKPRWAQIKGHSVQPPHFSLPFSGRAAHPIAPHPCRAWGRRREEGGDTEGRKSS